MKNKNRTILGANEKTALSSVAKALESSSAFSLAKAFDNSSVSSLAKPLENSSAFSLAKAFDNSPVSSLAKSLENSSAFSLAKAFNNSSAFSFSKALENPSIFSAKKALENPSFLSAVKALNESSRFSSFNHLADILSSKNIGPLTLSEAYQVVTESYVKTPAKSNDARLEKVSDQVEERIKNAPYGVLSREFYLSMVLTLVLFWLSQLSTMESEERLLNKIEQLQTNITQQISEYESKVIDETFYIVERGVNFRTKPNTKSEVLVVLHPNQKVRLIERKSKWIKVEYFNYIENTFISGWVFKKYLKRIK